MPDILKTKLNPISITTPSKYHDSLQKILIEGRMKREAGK